MKKKWWWLSAVLGVLLLLGLGMIQPFLAKAGGPGNASPTPSLSADDYTDQLIVKYRNSSFVKDAVLNANNAGSAINARVNALSVTAGVALSHFRFMSGDGHVLKLPDKMTRAEVESIARRLKNDPNVEYAEPDAMMQPFLTPNDPQYANQWHYKAPASEIGGANLPAAWDNTTGSSNIVVAVIDTGIRFDHADIAGRTVAGYNFISDYRIAGNATGRSADASDLGDWITSAERASGFFAGCTVSNSSWHGTHTAGTIGAASNNGIGVTGVNWISKILPVRVLGKCGGYTSDIVDGMRWAAGLSVTGVPANPNPAKVMNLSLGGASACNATWQNAIDDVIAAGASIVVAAGNSNANVSGFSPAGCTGVITVAATNRLGGRAFYSNYGTIVKIAAPGGDKSSSTANGVLSTLNTGTTTPVASPGGDTYSYYQGTSMAAPHVTGIVSLMLSVNPSLTPAQVLSRLQSTARVFPTGTGSDCTTSTCGAGIVNAALAVGSSGLYASFTGNGVYKYGATWTKINTLVPSTMAASATELYAGFTGYGVYKYNGSTWTKINTLVPSIMAASATELYACFTGYGVYKYNGTAWSRINALFPTIMAASMTDLYASITGNGVIKYNGTTWSRINTLVPTIMAASGTELYASFTGYGVYKYNGTTWSRINTLVPTIMAVSGADLYASFTGNGVYKYNGTAWNRITTLVPNLMAATSTNLYVNFAGYGLYKYNGATWSRINTTSPASMVGSR